MANPHYLETINIGISGPGLLINDSAARIIKVLIDAGYTLNIIDYDGRFKDTKWLDEQIACRKNQHKTTINISIDELPWGG